MADTQNPTAGDEDGMGVDDGIRELREHDAIPEHVKKMSSERIIARLIRSGRDEEDVLGLTRPELLHQMSELLLDLNTEAGGARGDTDREMVVPTDAQLQMKQLELRERELLFQEHQLDVQYEMQKMQNEVRLEELRVKDQRDKEGLDIKRENLTYQQNKEDSLTARTKRYADALKNVLPRMPDDLTEIPSYFQLCEHLWQIYEVPTDLQAKLLIPQLSQKARTLISRLSVAQLSSYTGVRDFLINEFRLTPREFRGMFVTAARNGDETHQMFKSRIMNYLTFYLRSRKCDTYERLCDLLVADQLKDSLSSPCLRYCLACEGDKTFTASEIANMADTYDANYHPDGNYRGYSARTNVQTKRAQRVSNKDSPDAQAYKATPYSSGNPQTQHSSGNVKAVNSNVTNNKIQQPAATRGVGRGCWRCGSLSHYRNQCDARPTYVSTCNATSEEHFTEPNTCDSDEGAGGEREISPFTASVSKCGAKVVNNHDCGNINPDVILVGKHEMQDQESCLPDHHSDGSDGMVDSITDSANVYDENEVAFEPDNNQGTICTHANSYTPNTVNLCELAYVNIHIDGATHCSYKTLIDSGAMLPIVRKSVVADMDISPMGTVKIQGIFDNGVVAPLISLNVAICDGGNDSCHGSLMPIMFAAVDNMNADCDIIMPELVIHDLQSDDQPITVSGVTSGQMSEHEVEYIHEPVTNDNPNTMGVGDDGEAPHGEADDQGECQNVDDTPVEVVNPENLKKLIADQHEDQSLKMCWDMAKRNKGNMLVRNGVLYHLDKVAGWNVEQLCVPVDRREEVIQLAHQTLTGGHLRAQKTRERIRLTYYWPNMRKQILSYCQACMPCQCRARARTDDRVPITPIVRPSLPFVMCHADCIGPLDPPSSKGHKYALCIIDSCTRWPSVYLLKSLTCKAVCDAFMDLFTYTGCYQIVVMDRGSNFCGELTKEFLNRLDISPRFLSPGHPQGNGVIERFNSTFKNMLHFAMREHGRAWDKTVPFLLWALREVPNSTTGLSPFMLQFGVPPKGVLSLLKDTWTGQRKMLSSKTVEQYMHDLAKHITSASQYAEEHSRVAQEQYAKYHNKHASEKSFVVGEQVIVLEKDNSSKTYAQWKTGSIAKVLSPYSYLVNMPNGACRHLHANKIRKLIVQTNHIGIVNEEDVDFGDIEAAPTEQSVGVQGCKPSREIDRSLLSNLSDKQQQELLSLLDEFGGCFSDKPGFCPILEHAIHVTADFKPRHCRAYRVPEVLKVEIEKQVDQLLKMGFIVPSTSPMASGVVCVMKPDKTVRLTCDFRYLNQYTIGDCQPMPNIVDSMYRVARANYISLCDAKSGYWQLNVRAQDRWLTSFVTHHGQWEWVRMPFGLKCAGNTFVRVVQAILRPIRAFSDSYIDDMSVLSNRFREHLAHLRDFLSLIRSSGLTLSLKKCQFAKREVTYVGHIVGGGKHRPDPTKLEAISRLRVPENKKQICQVLGALGFYRAYIPNYAEISAVLTRLTGSKSPNRLAWTEREQTAFDELKHRACTSPVLMTPRFGQPFQMYTDASNISIGCCLAQLDVDGCEHPIAYASHKLTATQSAWSTIECEAYAVMWALKRFRDVIFGCHITVYTDHDPLKFLTESAPKSAKLTRWSLALQEYSITIKYTKGARNILADALSRLNTE